MRRADTAAAIPLLIGALMSIFAILQRPVQASELLLLDVIVNGHPIGKIGEFTLRDDALFATPGELHSLGFASWIRCGRAAMGSSP
jgi:outer membrane usher protein